VSRGDAERGAALRLDIAEFVARIERSPAASVDGDSEALADPATLRPASVLVPVVDREHSPTLLLTQRTTRLREHAGQVAFPGGRIERSDPTPEAAALRESREEIGLAANRVRLIGRLDEYRTGTGFRITPVIGIVRPPFELSPDPGEVDAIFEVPLVFLFNPANHQRTAMHHDGALRHFFDIRYGERRIWGATAGMIVNLYRRLAAA
jgi:8-oxo-dGTP pyrophosphatase MutT (NUDIX family)